MQEDIINKKIILGKSLASGKSQIQTNEKENMICLNVIPINN